MKITLFTSDKLRHNYLINLLSNYFNEVYVIQESLPKVSGTDFKSDVINEYFDKVNKTEIKMFNNNINKINKSKVKILSLNVVKIKSSKMLSNN